MGSTPLLAFALGAEPLDELACSATRSEEAQRVLRTYYAEEAKASIDEVYSRWATFLGQVEAIGDESPLASIREQTRLA